MLRFFVVKKRRRQLTVLARASRWFEINLERRNWAVIGRSKLIISRVNAHGNENARFFSVNFNYGYSDTGTSRSVSLSVFFTDCETSTTVGPSWSHRLLRSGPFPGTIRSVLSCTVWMQTFSERFATLFPIANLMSSIFSLLELDYSTTML